METWQLIAGAIGMTLTLGSTLAMLVRSWNTETTNQRLAEERHKMLVDADEAIWSEIMEIKRSLGLTNGGTPKYVTTERIKAMEERQEDDKRRLDSHSDRLRTLEIQVGAK